MESGDEWSRLQRVGGATERESDGGGGDAAADGDAVAGRGSDDCGDGDGDCDGGGGWLARPFSNSARSLATKARKPATAFDVSSCGSSRVLITSSSASGVIAAPAAAMALAALAARAAIVAVTPYE